MTEDYVMELYYGVVYKLMSLGHSPEEAEEAARNAMNKLLKDEKIKNFLDDIENLTGGPTIKITPKQYNEVKE